MMKPMFILGLLVLIASTQTTVNPKTNACACSNLLNQADCLAKSGCAWTFASTTNSTTNITTTSPIYGNCANSTTSTIVIQPPTYCLNVINPALCAQTIGCAFLNNTCTIFTGCSAFVQTTNTACQAISAQCTTDGTRCAPPQACSTYTTQALCSGNLATSGAKSCTWTINGSSGQCADKVCSDAPATYTTQVQCTGWIAGCLTTGKGCAISLGACNTYTQANGCTGMIGSDGPCTTDTSAGSTVCRPLICSDAPLTLSTNAACSGFVSGCLSYGKGCASSLSACNTYTQTQGCTGLIGSDGPCTIDTTAGSTVCRPLVCTDAPSSTNTNAGCSSFLAGCVTNGQGCANSLGACSSYTGTTTTCSSYIGSDGNCKGTSATAASCQARTCADAPTTTNTNAACSAFLTGCITTGAGCAASLGSCSSYTGTHTTCTQYIGSDGNCTAPSTQTASGACQAKVCTDASNTISTTSACQAFSYKCVTNGAGCIAITSCENSPIALSCQGNTSCYPNQICLNRSQCISNINQSQCLFNKQQYSSGGTVYQRACKWSSGACQNQSCSALSTSLTTDTACSGALAGCLTNGAGCLDIASQCTDYKGTQSQCNAFKGLNGTQSCTNITGATSTTNCIIRTCENANIGGTISSTANCTSWLAGCNFDGKNNCTADDCTKYYGTQTFCGAITTAKSGGNPQACWKTADVSVATTACIAKVCSHAPSTLRSNSDCNNFLTGCITNGAGCTDPNLPCSSYSGSLSTCRALALSDQTCTKTALFCKPLDCTQKTPPAGTANNKLWCQAFVDAAGKNCQYDAGPNCIAAAAGSCSKFIPTSGTTDGDKANSCYQLKLAGTATCGFATGGSTCVASDCSQFAIPSTATTPDQKLAFCKALTTDSSAAQNVCALATTTSTNCSARSCSDYGVAVADCTSYGSNCQISRGVCYTQGSNCSAYVIPDDLTADFQKAQYCYGAATNNGQDHCAYLAENSLTNCSPYPSGCNSIMMTPSNDLRSDFEKLGFCRALMCGYNLNTGNTCIPLGGCASYPVIGDSDAEKGISCASQYDNNKDQCTYSPGSPNCMATGATSCDTILMAGTQFYDSYSICKLYTSNGKNCGANQTTQNVCKDAECPDLPAGMGSQQICSAYLSTCNFDGIYCVTKADCTDYTAQSSKAGGPQENCSGLTDASGVQCTFKSGTNCAYKACTDSILATSADDCKAYLSTCLYNGSNCIAPESNCSSYLPEGANYATRATICNSLRNTSGARCTYIVESNTCANAVACSNQQLPTGLQTSQYAPSSCALIQDSNGQFCTWDPATPSICASRTCASAPTANTDANCNTWLSGCDQNTASACSTVSLTCSSAPTTSTTNTACETYKKGCLTNGAGCVDSTVACSGYRGTQSTCNAFVGNGISCSNTANANATAACINRTCQLNTTAKNDAACRTWLSTCVWGGSSGCVDPQPCSSFTGTKFSCPTFTANDGPCFGIGTNAAPAPCASTNSNCQAAPVSYNTDAQCKTWGSQCGLGNQCITRPSTCGGYTIASDCNNYPINGSITQTCAWNTSTSTCIPVTCDLLPATLTSDSACSTVISTCTTNGAGCITKGACSSYPQQACGPAATTDTQKVCIWSNSVCRPIQCTDNTTATSDSACNTYLAGCKTTGNGCALTTTCSIFKSAELCLFDITGSPCLWYKPSSTNTGTCINYTQCSDITSSSHAECQAASPQCTTNGTTCIAITGCSNTVLQASCIIGTDGNCGWLQAVGTATAACALFTNCSASVGTTTAQCQAWGPTCVSDGVACISRSTCSSYQTQTACSNAGTDGTCFWVAPTGITTKGTCRLQLCSDATTNMTTHTGCAALSAQTPCTTSGTACIQQGTCSSYTVSAGCVQGTDGVCFWEISTAASNTTSASTTSICRLKQCSDSILTTSAQCSTSISGVKCVSNGVNCIPQSTCSSYTVREACLGGGSDGACAFTPGNNTTTPDIGICAQFTQCSNANSDQTACNSRSDACYFNSTTSNGTTTQCQPHTCATKALGSSCQAVPSWDLSTYQICVLTGTTCAAGITADLTATSCYSSTLGTYSWSINSSSCMACVQEQTPNTTNNTVNNTANTYGCLIGIILLRLLV